MKRYFNKELLKCLVLSVDKSSREIAKDLGVAHSSFWGWMNGLYFPWDRHLKKMADYFKVDINNFWKDSDDPEFNSELKKIYMQEYLK